MGITTSAGERTIFYKKPKKVLNNNVLVRVDFDPSDDVVTKSGIVLSGVAGLTWQEASYVPRWGVVEMIPDRLKCKPDYNFQGVMDWQTELEISVGDKVFFSAMTSANAIIIEDGAKYYLINYADLILRGDMYPLNGYAIVEKVTEKTRRNGLILDFCDHINKKLGIVRYVGKPNLSYYGSDMVDAIVEVGDEVIFEAGFWTALEDELFATVSKDLGYVQRMWVIGKY